MKKSNWKKVMVICIMSILVITIIILSILLIMKKDNKESSQVIYVGEYEDYLDISGHVISDYDDYLSYFDNLTVKEDLFKNNNYVVVELEVDSCSENEIEIDDYSINGKELNVSVSYTANCGVCAPYYIYFMLPVGKDANKDVKVNIDSKARNKPNCPRDVAYKPIIYLYPTNETKVTVKLNHPLYLTSSYPKYNDNWTVIAKPNGDLYDYDSLRYYYGLYWEGNHHHSEMLDEGFVVPGDEVLSFLEEKLSLLGLTEREANEFIIYWLPKMEHNNYNYIRFETIEEIDDYMSLDINPKPDTLIRVMMDYKPLDDYIEVREQVLNPVIRSGFTVVEWGGSLID